MESLNTSEKKFEKRQWDNIENSSTPQLRENSKFMKQVGIEIGNEGKYTKQVIRTRELNFKGNLYEVYRKLFSKTFSKLLEKTNITTFNESDNNKNTTKDKNNKKGNKKHGSGQAKKEKIAEGIINKNIEKDIKELEKIECEAPLKNISHFQLTETGLLNIVMWNLRIIEHIKLFGKVKLPPQIYDAGLSLSRAIEYHKNIENISQRLIEDASIVLKKIDKYISYLELQINNSDLITECSVDTIGYSKCLNLYSDQYQVLQNMHNNINKDIPTFTCYTTPPGSGKTTLVVALTSLVSTCTKQNKQVVYVCYNNLVRTEVSKMLFQSATEFAILSDCICTPHFSCYDGKKPKIKGGETSNYNHNVPEDKKKTKNEILRIEMIKMEKRCDKYPKILVCDLESTRELFMMKDAKDKYVAYIDEPTAGAENANSNMLRYYTDIMMNCPKFTVCLSATMPKITEIPIIVQHFKDRYRKNNEITNGSADSEINKEESESVNIETITSNKIPINCVAVDALGYVVSPHQYIETNDDLCRTIKMIEENYFLKRFYTSHVMYDLMEKIKKNHSDKLINEYDFKNNFKTLSDINHSNIRTYCLKLLKCISEINDDELIKELPKKISKYSTVGFDDDTCCTTTAHMNLGSNLIIKKTPNSFLDTVEESGFLSDAPKLKDIFKNYDRVKSEYEKRCSTIKKDKEIQGDENSRSLSELIVPIMEWDDKYLINSTSHIKKYAKGYDFSKDVPLLKTPFISQINEEELKQLPDIYDQALMGGISIYDPSISLLRSYNDIYNDVAFSMADKSNLSYIVSNEAITYGTNLPIQKVIIDADVDFTQNMFYQLIGRAGRLGKSKSACVVFKGHANMHKTFSFKERNIEAENINSVASVILIEINARKEAEQKIIDNKHEKERRIKERMEAFERNRTNNNSN